MTIRNLILAAAGALGLSAPAFAADITPDIIFGSGNSNGGFTVSTFGDLELGIRAKRRYPPNDTVGDGIVQNAAGDYLFDTVGKTWQAGRSFWSFDWSINSDYLNGTSPLTTYSYLIGVDYDPTVNENIQTYDPLSAIGTGYYLGNNGTGNGAASFQSGGDEDFSLYNVAQNSVNMGFLPGAPIGSGQYTISLFAFDQTGGQAGSVSINVIVDAPQPVPLPAAGLLLPAGFGLMALIRRRRNKAA